MTVVYSETVQKPKRALGCKWYALVSFALPFFLYVLCLHYYNYLYGLNVLAMQYSMWSGHGLYVGTPTYSVLPGGIPNIDTITFQGRYYNAYAPGLVFLSFPFAAVGFVMDHEVFVEVGYALLMDELFASLCAALACYVLYKICLLYSGPRQSLIAALTLGLATTVFPFAVVTFPHDVTMLFMLLAVYPLLKNAHKGSSLAPFAVSGLCLAVASLLDYVMVFAFFPLAAYIIFCGLRGRGIANTGGRFVSFLFLFLLGPLLNLGYNTVLFHNPLTFPEQYFSEASTHSHTLGGLAGRFSLSGLALHLTYNLFSPYRGLFILSPVLFMGVIGLYMMLKSSSNLLKQDAVLFITLFFSIVLPYSAWDMWDAGGSFGPRFVIPVIPFLVIPISFVLFSARRKTAIHALFMLLFIPSLVFESLGALTSSSPPLEFTPLYFQPIMFSLPQVLHGRQAVWWIARMTNVPSLAPYDIDFSIFVIVLAAYVVLALSVKDAISGTAPKEQAIPQRQVSPVPLFQQSTLTESKEPTSDGSTKGLS